MARQTSWTGCVRRMSPGTGGWSMGFRRGKDFELFGRQFGAKGCDGVLQLGGCDRALSNIVGQPFLEGEGIAGTLVGFAAGAIRGSRTTIAGTTGAMIGTGRRQHRLQRAGVVAPGIELFASYPDAGFERYKPSCEHELRRRTHAMRTEALRSVPCRPVRPGILIRGTLVRVVLQRQNLRWLAGRRDKIGLLRKGGMNGDRGEQAERQKSALHDVILSHMHRMAAG